MTELDDIKRRLFSVLHTGSLHMLEFLKLINISYSDKTNSAAVSCAIRPELILNKDFVESYCKTDEHLFMLIMHEMYHIVLGHTNLFKRHSMLDNIAFDAIINAMLCRKFPEEEYVSFFTNLYSDELFPECILRPKGEKTPKEFVSILENIYETDAGTYYEIYEVLIKNLLKYGSFSEILLLGNHNESIYENKSLKERMIEKLLSDSKNIISDGRNIDLTPENREVHINKIKDKETEKKMRRLLRKAGISKNMNPKRNDSSIVSYRETIIPYPDYYDRTYVAKSKLYEFKPILFNSKISCVNKEKNTDDCKKIYVYLDVSGSVQRDLSDLISLLLEPYKAGKCSLFVFSTEVYPVKYTEFKEGKYKTTGGTSINCVLNHYLSEQKEKRPGKILILTDGLTGNPDSALKDKIKESRVRIFCGLFGDYQRTCLEDIVEYFEEF